MLPKHNYESQRPFVFFRDKKHVTSMNIYRKKSVSSIFNTSETTNCHFSNGNVTLRSSITACQNIRFLVTLPSRNQQNFHVNCTLPLQFNHSLIDGIYFIAVDCILRKYLHLSIILTMNSEAHKSVGAA